MNDDFLKLQEQVYQHSLVSSSIHDINHWKRVAKIGLMLCKEVKSADYDVVFLFSFFHDSLIIFDNNNQDPHHGIRAANYVIKMIQQLYKLGLTKQQINILVDACKYHVDGKTSSAPTIGVCWDADRIDLFGEELEQEFLSTGYAKHLLTNIQDDNLF